MHDLDAIHAELLAFKEVQGYVSTRIRELEEAERLQTGPKGSADDKLLGDLGVLSWTAARSGKCDYVHSAPQQLLDFVRAHPSGVASEGWKYTAHKTEPTLFRWKSKGASDS